MPTGADDACGLCAASSAKRFLAVSRWPSTTGKVAEHRLLAISGNTIKAVDDTKQASRYKADQVVDAGGKYAMPGLWAMHVHFRGGDSLIGANKNLLPLFLANGITTVRECGGDMTPSVMAWGRQTAKGELPGPRIFTSGPKLDGGPHPAWAGTLEVETPDQISKALDSLQKLHTDFVKIYDSKISHDAYLEIIRQAKKSVDQPTISLRHTISRCIAFTG